MALTEATFPIQSNGTVFAPTPVSVTSKWTTVLLAGAVDDADASTVNPSLMTDADHVLASREKQAGTQARVRMRYDDGVTGTITNPVLNAFGRTDGEQWQRLPNLDGEFDIEIEVDTTLDVTDGTNKWTHPDPTANTIDCDGCDELLFLVKTAFAASSGSVTNAVVEAKMI